MNPPDDRLPSTFAASTPVVLRIMLKVGSLTPIGYVYDPDPSRDGGEGGLLAASAAFFTHQGHEIFRDPCPDLTAYRRAGRITSTIVDMDRLPDQILAAGLDLLASSPPSSAGDILGMSFMAEYLPAPPPAAAPPVGPVSLSPPVMGDLGGAFAPSHQRLSRPFQSLCLVHVQLGDDPAQIPNPMCTHPAWPIIWAPSVSLPRLAIGGSTAVGATGHPHRLRPPSANHLPIPRFYGGGQTLPTCLIGGARRQAPHLSPSGQLTQAV